MTVHQIIERPHISDTGSTFFITSGRSLYYIFKIIMKNHVFFRYFNLKVNHFYNKLRIYTDILVSITKKNYYLFILLCYHIIRQSSTENGE